MLEVCEEQPENTFVEDQRFHFESSLKHAEQESVFETAFELYLFDPKYHRFATNKGNK